MPLDNKCRIGPLAGAPPDTCAVVISTETESGFITEDDTSPVCHTPNCPMSAKIQSTLPMMWGQWYLSGRRLLKPTSVSRLLMVSLDGTGCLEGVADFTQQLSSIHEQHAEELQMLVETFRKRNAELRRERPPYQSTLFTSWEVLLQEIEVDSQVHGDIARSLGRQVGMMLLEKTFHRKIQSRKIFLHRESFETILSKAEELLNKGDIVALPLPRDFEHPRLNILDQNTSSNRISSSETI
ncbi:uncharacterized protein TNCV_4962751 [Trichonephila clavipes]|nr:uncharacterized protein TNCV_4962751 [Trichonephila clavipes]